MIRLVRTSGHILVTLLNDPKTLSHLFHTHKRTIITIAVLCDGYIKLKILVAAVRHFFSEIIVKSTGTKVCARCSPFNCFVFGENANADRSCFEDCILHHHLIVLPEFAWEVVDEVFNKNLPANRKVLCYTADPKPIGVHAATTDSFNNIEYFFTICEHVEYR